MLMFTEKRLFRVMFVFTPPGLDLISQQYHPVICLLSSVSCHLSLSAFYFPICHHLAGYPAQQVAFFWLKTELVENGGGRAMTRWAGLSIDQDQPPTGLGWRLSQLSGADCPLWSHWRSVPHISS